MELRQLKYFLKIVEYGNMTRAAEVLHVAQPALSQQMRNLENDLGVRLFHRTANGLRPTEAALILRTQGRNILRQVDEAYAMVRSEMDRPTGEVAIALPSSTARMIAIPLLQSVRATYPGISVNFVEAPSAEMLRLLESGDADMVVAVDVNPKRTFSVVPLLTERLYVIELPSAETKRKKQVTIPNLAKLPLVLPATPNTIREHVDAALRRAHLDINLVAEINSTGLLLRAVHAGIGATVLPLSAAAEELESGRLIATPLAGASTTRQLLLCTLPKANQTTASTAVHSLIPDVVKQLIDSGKWKGARTL